jgi:hypothetical protein
MMEKNEGITTKNLIYNVALLRLALPLALDGVLPRNAKSIMYVYSFIACMTRKPSTRPGMDGMC